MRNHHIYLGSLALMGLVVGCKPATPPDSHTPATMNARSGPAGAADKANAQALWNQPDTDKPIITDVKGNEVKGADALAQATNDYAHELEVLMAKRDELARRSGRIPQLPPGIDPSPVRFEDPAHPRATNTATANGNNATIAGATIPGGERPATPREQVASVPSPVANPNQTITTTPPRQEVPFNKDSPAANTMLIPGQPRPLAAGDEIGQKLSKQIKDYPQDIASQLDFQLLQMLQGQSVPQLQTLAPLQAEDREMLSAVLDGLTNFRNALRADNNMLLSRKIRPMLDTADRLRTQAELSIPTIALCTDVKGFGVYEPLEPARFPADGKEHRVIVYCEVENFSSQLDEQKRWETKLTQDVVLYTEQNGLEVWRDKAPARPIVDYSRNRRHDFFIVKMVRIPANLTIGRYLLKVTVTDQGVNRVAENAVPITIVAQ